MRGGTGAPGEITWTPKIRSNVAVLLRARGFKVTEVDANVNCHPTLCGPYDLTLAIHYQSNTGKSGFGVYVPDASVDQVRPRSIALARRIADIYGRRTGLTNYSSPVLGFGPVTWENPNTEFYYAWRTQLGPLALIECGEGALGAPDHNLLYLRPDVIAGAIAEGICAAFGVAFSTPAQIAAAKAAADAKTAAVIAAARAAQAAADAKAAAARAAANAADAAAQQAAADAAATAAKAAKEAQNAADAAARAADAQAIADAVVNNLFARFFGWIFHLLGRK